MITVDVTVNGRRYREDVEPRLLLSDFLRTPPRPHRDARRLRARGLRRVHGAARRRRRPLVPPARRAGRRRRDRHRRGARRRGQLTPLQEAFRRHHALQCGFCTPGILIAAEDLLSRETLPTRDEIVDMLSGQLCRCTGYTPIVDAIAEVAGA